ncbi:MAG: hypothetical protein ONB44_13140 [candidate division KSB1 bacterium]|nr:hypothetical protein [candidate division KSB1 bacterium]MDZ7303066.1 hypothetical protein [candidate division KSB1 bacterium]MDZ7314396.1 hypothetical protein [candidate division KSB1 bacterium]
MQQKFLLVLSTIIVGMAIVAGFKTSQESLLMADQYGVMQEALIIAGRAQAWYLTPTELGGGGGSFARLTLAAINYDSVNVYGTFSLSDRQEKSIRVTGIGTEGNPLRVTLQVFPNSVSTIHISP